MGLPRCLASSPGVGSDDSARMDRIGKTDPIQFFEKASWCNFFVNLSDELKIHRFELYFNNDYFYSRFQKRNKYLYIDHGGHKDILTTINSQLKKSSQRRSNILNLGRSQGHFNQIDILGRVIDILLVNVWRISLKCLKDLNNGH